MDKMTPQQRSYCMSQIKSKNTKPELLLRKSAWKKGIRGYRIHANVKGKPDLYFPKKKVAVFVDGCFWHRCSTCFRAPKSNDAYWGPKLRQNAERDFQTDLHLKKEGIHVLRLWEHEVKKEMPKCIRRIKKTISKF